MLVYHSSHAIGQPRHALGIGEMPCVEQAPKDALRVRGWRECAGGGDIRGHFQTLPSPLKPQPSFLPQASLFPPPAPLTARKFQLPKCSQNRVTAFQECTMNRQTVFKGMQIFLSSTCARKKFIFLKEQTQDLGNETPVHCDLDKSSSKRNTSKDAFPISA